ncbi:YdeI/OmpD-associated family protein [Flavihumibacter fluvii]|uniref:YdeI/OmpD-associated family protein n=1 Tax=Flavihumibacter fluvii TaxID=2838157 RepID=UPI001EFA46EE|nr:YdeI/OmpD-associated family protein [Flavihumibacter fluvii]ULQ53844.1 YdeI/OmpD-associated family protein [Flavihumibacter fluvii]
MLPTLFEKLQFKEEKNLLIQGLPSSIEKQFSKVAFAKNVTPLLKSRRIDFALVFAINEHQLNGILQDVLPALNDEAKLWIAYPKTTSKIVSNLNRDCSWDMVVNAGYEGVRQVALDSVWSALRFKRAEQIKEMTRASENGGQPAPIEGVDTVERTVTPPPDLEKLLLLKKNKKALDFFDKLSFTNKKEYVAWITTAKKEETRQNRLMYTIEKLMAGKKNPTEK